MEVTIAAVQVYKPLNIDKHEFRILRLSSRRTAPSIGVNDAVIACSLEYASLEDNVGYDALSYAWDAPMGTSEISLDGERLPISANLMHALHNLQHFDADRLLWADQLYINQSDEVEKADQIKKMTRIYAQAQQVLAWIGPSTLLTDLAMCTLYHAGRRNTVKGTKLIVADIVQDLNQPKSAHGKPSWSHTEVYEKLSEALMVFSDRSYWTRLWVLQEFAVGSRVTVMCGGRALQGDLLEEAWHVLRFAFDNRHEKANEYQARSWTAEIRGFIQPWKPLGSSWDNWLAVKRLLSQRHEVQMIRAQIAAMQTQPQHRYSQFYHSYERDNCLYLIMYRNLTTFSGNFMLKCADPRDRCFALLGLGLDKQNFESLVDYSKTTSEVFKGLAQQFLLQGHIDVLSFCQEGPGRKSTQLPSWAPDWAQKIRIPAWGKIVLNAFPQSDSINVRTPDTDTIVLNGVYIDKIKACGQRLPRDEPLTLRQTQTYLSDLERFCLESDRIPDEHVRFVCAQIPSPTAKAFIQDQDRMLECYLELEELLIGADDDGFRSDPVTNAASLYEEVLRLQLLRCPFITTTGYVGISQPFIEDGDIVCAFPGGSTPYVLRPLPDGEASELVSAAYVKCVMNGECARAELQRRDFVLK